MYHVNVKNAFLKYIYSLEKNQYDKCIKYKEYSSW